MLLAADYPFLDLFWTLIIFFLWMAWIMVLFRVFGDIFSRHDIGGGKKAAWVVFTIFAPFLGVLVYLIAENDGMTERALARARSQQAQMDDYIRDTATSGGGAAAEIDKAKQLLDSGAITQPEYELIKQKALA